MSGHGLWCCSSLAGCLWCSWLSLGFGLLMGPVWFGARSACPAASGSGVRCGRACWRLGFGCAPPPLGGMLGCVCGRAPVPRGLLQLRVGVAVRGCVFVRAPLVPRLSWLRCGVWACLLGPGLCCAPPLLVQLSGCVFCPLFLGVSWLGFVVSVAGCPCPRPCGPCPPIPFLSGWSAGSFFFPFFSSVLCVCMFRCPFSRWAAVPGLVVLFLAGWSPCAPLGVLSSVPSGWGVWPPLVVLAGGLVAVGCSLAPPPSPPCCFFFGGGVACSSLCLPWARARTGPHSAWSSGLLSAVAFCLPVFRLHGSVGLCTRWARRPFLPGQVRALPAGLLRQAAACGSGVGGWGCPCSAPLRCRFEPSGWSATFVAGRALALCVACGAGVWCAGAALFRVCGGLFRLVLQVRVSRAVLCRSVLWRVASCCGALLCGALWCGVPWFLLVCDGSVEVSLACVSVRSAGRSVAGWWLGGAVRCGCLAGSVLSGPWRAARAGGSGRRPSGCPPWGPVPWSLFLWGSQFLALVAVAVPSSSSGACEVALVVAGVVAWR